MHARRLKTGLDRRAYARRVAYARSTARRITARLAAGPRAPRAVSYGSDSSPA